MALKQKKRILFVHHGKGIGGAALSLLYLTQGVALKGVYEPHVLFLHHSAACTLFTAAGVSWCGPARLEDMPHTHIFWYRWYHMHHILKSIIHFFLTLFFYAPRWYKRTAPCLVHLNTSSLSAWAIAAWWQKIPVVWHIREPLAPGYLGIRKWLATVLVHKYATLICPISHDDARPWRGNSRVEVVYNASPWGKEQQEKEKYRAAYFLKKWAVAPHEKILLFLGGLSQEKGALESLLLLKELRSRGLGVRLAWAGSLERTTSAFSPTAFYERKIEVLRKTLSPYIISVGLTDKVSSIMAASWLLLFPSTQPHFARPIIEAGMLGLVSLASSWGACPELIVHKETGLLLPPCNTREWADAACYLATHPSSKKRLEAHAINWCSRNFSIEQQISRMHALYKNHI